MGDVGDDFRAMKEEGQRRRASNRNTSASLLEEKGIAFVSKNMGAHLIVEGSEGHIDFWPGTGRWKVRKDNKTGFGVYNLIKFITRGNEIGVKNE